MLTSDDSGPPEPEQGAPAEPEQAPPLAPGQTPPAASVEALVNGAASPLALDISWLLLTCMLLLPLLIAELPPLYDYYHWLFDGHIVSLLLFGDHASDPVFKSYSLRWGPIPNLASSLLFGLLNRVVDPLPAGRLILAFVVLAFAYSFAFLVRSAQKGPTAVGLLGCVWAYGYFLYKGYISFLISLALAFLAVGMLERFRRSWEKGPKARRLAVLAALGMLLYLSHLAGWGVFVLATLVYALEFAGRGSRKSGLLLAATNAPAAALFAWYLFQRHGRHTGLTVSVYESVLDKLRSLVESLLLFMRTDPLPPAFPVFFANIVGFLLIGGILIASVDRNRSGPASRSLLRLGAVLAAVSILMPLSDASGMGRPDERFALPALLVTIAALRYKSCTSRRAVVTACLVLLILAPHVVEYKRASKELLGVVAVTEAAILPAERVLSITLQQSAVRGACEPQTGFTIGTPVLKWLDLVRVLATGGLKVNLMETSVVYKNFYDAGPHDFYATCLTRVMTVHLLRKRPDVTSHYAVVELLGCPEELRDAAGALAPLYEGVAVGDWIIVMRATSGGHRPPL